MKLTRNSTVATPIPSKTETQETRPPPSPVPDHIAPLDTMVKESKGPAIRPPLPDLVLGAEIEKRNWVARDPNSVADTLLELAKQAQAEQSAVFRFSAAAASHLLRELPAANHLYVGIGRSPATVIGMLHAMGGASARSIPLSNFHYGIPFTPKLTDELRQVAYDHFKRFLPSPSELEGKTLVLMDYFGSGQTLRSAHKAIHEYYTSLGATVDISVVALIEVPPCNDLGLEVPAERAIQIRVDELDEKTDESLLLTSFKDFAPFGKMDIRDEEGDCTGEYTYRPEPNDVRAEYLKLVEDMRAWLKRGLNITKSRHTADSSSVICDTD